MKPSRIVVIVVVGVVLIAGALIGMGAMRSSKLAELQKQAETELKYKRADVYFKGTDEDKKYADELFVFAKDSAKISLNGFLAPPPSEQRYFTAIYQIMINEAKHKGKNDFAKSLQNFAVGQGFIDVKF